MSFSSAMTDRGSRTASLPGEPACCARRSSSSATICRRSSARAIGNPAISGKGKVLTDDFAPVELLTTIKRNNVKRQ